VTNTFFVAGPTAVGKSEIAADVAWKIGGEIVSADAFQIYRGFPILTAKPDAATLAKAPHHLVGTISASQEINAENFRELAQQAIDDIHARGKVAIVAGGTGLYLKALTHGLSASAGSDPKTRAKLEKLTLEQLQRRLAKLDPASANKIDMKNRRRVQRALEICLLTGQPASQRRTGWTAQVLKPGIFMFREREDLYARINRRVEEMFERGVIEEVRAAGSLSATASQMIGFREIRDLIDGKMSILQCMASIQQRTRHYAKRQLTWFRHQTNFQPLNLSVLSHVEAVIRISQLAKTLQVAQGND
jgi:tRNA dimethylallyltransferase